MIRSIALFEERTNSSLAEVITRYASVNFLCQLRKCAFALITIAVFVLGSLSQNTVDVWSNLSLKGTSRSGEFELIESEKIAEVKSMNWTRQELTDAAKLFLQISDDWDRLLDHGKSASCLRKAGKLNLILGNKPLAESLFNKALYIANKANAADEISLNLSELSVLALSRGDIRKSKAYCDKALKYADESGSAIAKASANSSLGNFFDSIDENDPAVRFYSDAVALWKTAGNAREEALNELNLGYVYLKKNEHATAFQMIQSSYNKSVETNDSRGMAFALKGLGTYFSLTGENQKAITSYASAKANFPDDLDSFERASLFYSIGYVYELLGDWRPSFDYRIKALEIFEIDQNIAAQTTALTSLGALSHFLKDDELALQFLNRAHKLAINSDDRLYIAITNEELGNLSLNQKKYQEALTYYRNSLRFLRPNDNQRQIGRIYSKLGQVYESLNKLDKANIYYHQSLKLNQVVKDRYAESQTIFQLAKLDQSLNNQDSALNLAKRSIEITEKLSADVSNSRLKRTYFSSVYDLYELYVHLLMQKKRRLLAGDFGLQALQAREWARARAMLEDLSMSEADFTADADSANVQKEKDIRILLNSTVDKLTELLSRNGHQENVQKLESEIRSLENQLEEIKAELKQKSPIYSAIKNPEPFDVEGFQRQVLGDDDLLLEFSLGKEESYLWAVDKRDVTAYYLPPREQIEARVEKLRSLLSARRLKDGETLEEYQKRLADAETEYKAEVRALSNELLGQVAADKLAGKKLIVVADGRLHYFPLGSLPMPNSESDDPIFLTNEVVYTPSASTLKILRMKKTIETRPQKDLLVFADPVFSKSDELIAGLDTSNNSLVSMIMPMFRSIESLESLPRLPASEDEAKSISEVVGANQTTVRAGFAANRDGVLNGGIEDYKILHFATHGLIDEKRPELSGILLSLFNDEGKQNDGGFIRLHDVYGLRLNSDLVVLSACDTGIGKEIKGEGVMSLNNAFLQAGARSVVSSLWKVDDTATKDLMTEFYRGMADDNLTAAAALRQAQIKMYNDPRYRSPFYWAAFTASGDDRVKVAFTSYAWLYALVATAVIAVVLLALLGVLRRSRRI